MCAIKSILYIIIIKHMGLWRIAYYTPVDLQAFSENRTTVYYSVSPFCIARRVAKTENRLRQLKALTLYRNMRLDSISTYILAHLDHMPDDLAFLVMQT